jgi:hypothetical protein
MFVPVENRLGIQPIAFTNPASTLLQSGQSPFFNQEHPLGTIVRAYDSVLGEGEFIYLLGVVNTVVGLLYTWDISTFQTTVLAVTANLNQPVAVAMSANVAGQYGWYQISGMATVLKTAVQVTPAPLKVYISGTAGRVFVTSTSGREIMGARTANVATVTSTTSTVLVHMSRPFAQGQIT